MIRSLQLLTVDVRAEQDVVLARQRARQIARLLGFDLQAQTKIGTAISEIVRNAFRYAGGGRVSFAFIHDAHRRLVMTVVDQGPGIPGLDDILAGRYVSKTGMGMGLVGTRRIMDRVEIASVPGKGTTVTMSKFLPAKSPTLGSEDFTRIAEVLAHGLPDDPLGEVQQQNQELLALLGELTQRQAELQAVNKELEDTNRGVVALYAELDARADFLRKTTEVKSRFLSNMTHEFRTPLNSINALANMLLDRTDGELGDEQARQVGFILRSAQDLATLVNDLLDIAKVDAGKVTVRAKEFSIGDLFGALKGMLRPLLGPGTTVVLEFVDIDPQLTLVSDEGKVSQILRNFISNALKYTEIGRVRVSAEARGETMVFAVADTGIGIRSEHIPVIFEEFGQVETGVPQRFKGTGLGLSLSKRLAEMLGGSVRVESAVGIGSTFFLEVPLRYRGADEGVLVQAEAIRPESFRQALIIDDDEVSRYLIRGLFPRGFETSDLSDGQQASAAIARLAPDVAFINVDLEGGRGLAILQRLRADPGCAGVPVVAYAGRALDPAMQAACAQADAFFMLSPDATTAAAAMSQILAKLGLAAGIAEG